MAPDNYITIREAATSLGISPFTVRTAIRTGKMRIHKADAWLTLVHQDDVESYRLRHLGWQGWHKRKDKVASTAR